MISFVLVISFALHADTAKVVKCPHRQKAYDKIDTLYLNMDSVKIEIGKIKKYINNKNK